MLTMDEWNTLKTQLSETINTSQKAVEEGKSRLLFSVCLSEDVNTLFLPCRHLVCCRQCSDRVINCVYCRKYIIGTIHVFI